MDLPQLKAWTAALAAQVFRPSTMVNHVHHADCFIKFCDHYSLKFINPSPSTLCYFITHLSATFLSSKSVRNYVSGVWFLHKQRGRAPESLASFQVSFILHMWAADLTMRTAPLRHLPILPHFFTQLCSSPPSWTPCDLP